MTESPTPPSTPQHRRAGGLQTKALAGLVAIMLAAAVVALVFVTNGGGSTKGVQAGGSSPSDVGRTSSAPSSPAPSTSKPVPASSSASTSTTSTGVTGSGTSKPATSTTKPSTSSSSSHTTSTKKLVYTVKKGDTLIAIGRWYRDHGYLTLYNWNKSVIGEDPNLIFPGQNIIVVDGNVGVARQSH